MKKLLLTLVIIMVTGLMVFVLLRNRATANLKAKNANQQTAIPVSTVIMKRQTLQDTFDKTGTIVANNEVSVVSQASGKVIAMYVNVGSYVKAGSPIAKIEDNVLRSKLTSARTAYTVAQKEWERANQLHQEKIISDSDLDTYKQTLITAKAALDSAQQDYNDATITAPVSGIITERAVDRGATVSSGTVIATLIDNSVFKITVNVNEEQAFKLKVGDMVTIATNVYPDIKLSGRIKSISAKSDSIHTFPVEITILNDKAHPLKSGVFGKITFNLGGASDVLAIPRAALVGSIKMPQVYVIKNGHAVLRDIVVDSEVNAYLIVKDGLKENDQVVVDGQENLNNNSLVKIYNRK